MSRHAARFRRFAADGMHLRWVPLVLARIECSERRAAGQACGCRHCARRELAAVGFAAVAT